MPLDAAAFRRDRYLRSSAYHLATWSLAAFVLAMSLGTAGPETRASSAAMVAVVIAASLLNSMTHERRVGKMVGPAGEAAFAGAGTMWARLFVLLLVTSLGLVAAGAPGLLFAIWPVGVGAGFLRWGRAADFPWYVGLGALMLAAGLLDLALQMAGGPVLMLRVLVFGAVLPAGAVLTNRRYLWFRSPAA